MQATDHAKSRHVDLILREIGALPTLPAVATRLLAVTADDDADAGEVVQLIGSDPAMTAKVLSLCRRPDRALPEAVLTIERAVLALGFQTVRAAVLSVSVFDMFGPASAPPGASAAHEVGAPLDLVGLWRHCLAVAIAAEMIAERSRATERRLAPGDAFVCGLLHDIGKIALHRVLPKSYRRVVAHADEAQGDVAAFERRVIGVDHHTAGKRLAEQWGLPRLIRDAIWLHGTPLHLQAELEHRAMVALVGLADEVVRAQHVGYSGNHLRGGPDRATAEALGLDADALETVVEQLHQQVAWRSQTLGLDDEPGPRLFMDSIRRANDALGRLNAMQRHTARAAASRGRVLDAIGAFHAALVSGGHLHDVLDAVAISAAGALAGGCRAILYAARHDEGRSAPCLLARYGPDAGALDRQWVEAPDPRGTSIGPGPDGPVEVPVPPWVVAHLRDGSDPGTLTGLVLPCGRQVSSVVVHQRRDGQRADGLEPLISTWGSAIALAAEHDEARQMAEELAHANRALHRMQEELLQARSLACLGEMAAGAAHEMNNPLAVISGRAQLLVLRLAPGSEEQGAAGTIAEQAERLSDLITSLHDFATPLVADRRPTDVETLARTIIDEVGRTLDAAQAGPTFAVRVDRGLEEARIDPDLIGAALRDLLLNAVQARPRRVVSVRARRDADPRTLRIDVCDDGTGMDAHTLAHAMDPFFSAREAGRGPGMGLSRAGRAAAAHGGTIRLQSRPGEGTVASLLLPAPPASPAPRADVPAAPIVTAAGPS